MQDRKNFIFINEEFKCQNCGKNNDLLKAGCRNHCKYCLYSVHVDKNIPGDRKNNCKCLMKPISIDKDGKKGYIIIHKCTKCNEIKRNKAAEDDDFDAIIKISLNN